MPLMKKGVGIYKGMEYMMQNVNEWFERTFGVDLFSSNASSNLENIILSKEDAINRVHFLSFVEKMEALEVRAAVYHFDNVSRSYSHESSQQLFEHISAELRVALLDANLRCGGEDALFKDAVVKIFSMIHDMLADERARLTHEATVVSGELESRLRDYEILRKLFRFVPRVGEKSEIEMLDEISSLSYDLQKLNIYIWRNNEAADLCARVISEIGRLDT
jgi:hypothetical protein